MDDQAQKATILIVDDNPQNLRVLISVLTSQGYKVRPAPSGSMALESAFSNPPDLILLDIMMPGIDGYEVCEKLKTDPRTGTVPVIFISALDALSDKIKAFELGGVDYITKPFQTEEIIARVNTHVYLRQIQRQLENEIAVRKRSEKELKILSQKYDSILAAAGEGILGLDKNGNHTFVNPAALAMLGFATQDELIGKSSHGIWHHIRRDGMPYPEADCPVYGTLKSGEIQRITDEVFWRKDGTFFEAEYVSTPIHDKDQIEGAVVIFSDISERKRLENQLKQLATQDSLTGISNRRHFLEQAEKEMNRSERYERPLTFLMMDIDHFKKINDGYGHQTGDAVLIKISEICLNTLRAVDLFGRLGGEEFGILMPETDLDSALRAAERIRRTLAESWWIIADQHVSCTVSIGIAESHAGDLSLNELMKKADEALYAAKESGRNCVRTA